MHDWRLRIANKMFQDCKLSKDLVTQDDQSDGHTSCSENLLFVKCEIVVVSI